MYVRTATPAGLGVAPLVAAAVAAGAFTVGAGSMGGLWAWLTNKQAEGYEEWKTQVQPPVRPPAPAAPQTPEELRNWNIQLRQAREREQWERWRVTAIPALPPYNGDDGPLNGKQRWLIYGALGLAGLALVFGMRR